MSNSEHTHAGGLSWGLPLVFLLLALSFFFDVWGRVAPVAEQALVDPVFLNTDPVQQPRQAAIYTKIGFDYSCASCHQHFKPAGRSNNLLAEHHEIEVKHSEGMVCQSCHNPKDFMMSLNTPTGQVVGFERSEHLCKGCHGPVYRGWLQGSHGRRSGYWDERAGEQVRLTCVQCHNPHQPAFPHLHPAPPPREERSAPTETHKEKDPSHHG